MLYYILELIFGGLEVFATLFLTLALFRIPIRPYFLPTIVMSIIVSLLCLVFYNLLNIAYIYGEVVSIALYILLLFKFTPLTLKQSIISAVIGYLVGPVLLTGLVYFLLTNLDMISETMISTNIDHMLSLMTVQFVYALFAFLLGQILFHMRIGFIFVKEEIVNAHRSIKIQVITVLSISIISFLYLVNVVMYNPTFLDLKKIIFCTVIIFAVMLFLYLVNIEKITEEHKKLKEKIRL